MNARGERGGSGARLRAGRSHHDKPLLLQEKVRLSTQLPSMFRLDKEGTPSRPITAAPPPARGTTERPARRDRRARSSARRRPSRIASRTTARAPCLSVRPRASTSRPSAPCCAASWTTTPRMRLVSARARAIARGEGAMRKDERERRLAAMKNEPNVMREVRAHPANHPPLRARARAPSWFLSVDASSRRRVRRTARSRFQIRRRPSAGPRPDPRPSHPRVPPRAPLSPRRTPTPSRWTSTATTSAPTAPPP